MVSIRKIAEMAGVAPITVSRALADKPKVKAELRARIKALAEQYHYRPNRVTEQMLTGKTRIIGCVMPVTGSDFAPRVLSGILQQANAADYRTIIMPNEQDIHRTILATHALVEHRVDGLIYYCSHAEAFPARLLMEIWSNTVIPIAIDASPFETPIDMVGNDERHIAQLLVDTLLAHGHQHLAFVGMVPSTRFRALLEVMADRRLEFSLVHDCTTLTEHMADDVLALLRKRPEPITGVICFEDYLAARLLQSARKHGLAVPGELSLISCGNKELGLFTDPPLTTIEQYPERLGRRAVDLLLQRLEAAEYPVVTPVTLTSDVELILRGSCGPRT